MLSSLKRREQERSEHLSGEGGGEDSHCVTPYTWQIVTSTGQRSTTDEKSEIFCLCSERVCVCVMGEGDGISPQNTCIDTVIQKLQISRF